MHARKSQTDGDGSDETLLEHVETEKPSSVLKSSIRWSTLDGRRLLFATCACLAAASLFGLLSVTIWTYQSKGGQIMIEHEVPHGSSSSAHDQDRWLPSAVLLGPPTSSFKGM